MVLRKHQLHIAISSFQYQGEAIAECIVYWALDPWFLASWFDSQLGKKKVAHTLIAFRS